MKFKLIKTTNRENKNVISQIRKRRTQKRGRSCDLNSSAFIKGNYRLKVDKTRRGGTRLQNTNGKQSISGTGTGVRREATYFSFYTIYFLNFHYHRHA